MGCTASSPVEGEGDQQHEVTHELKLRVAGQWSRAYKQKGQKGQKGQKHKRFAEAVVGVLSCGPSLD